MAIPIQTLAKQAFDLALSLVPTAFATVTVRMGSTRGAYNPATDTYASETWEQEVAVSALAYDDADERKDAPVEQIMRSFLVSLQDLTDSGIDQDGQIEEADGTTWDIYRVEIDPSRSVAVFFCRR